MIDTLDTNEGERYSEMARDVMENGEVKNIYNIIERKKDYVNPTANEYISWCSICPFNTNLGEAM